MKLYASVVSACLLLGNAAVANTLYSKCQLLTSRAPDAPYTVNLALDQDARKLTWMTDSHERVLEVAPTTEGVSFRGPYTDTPSFLNRTTGSLVVLDATYRKLEFLCQHRSN